MHTAIGRDQGQGEAPLVFYGDTPSLASSATQEIRYSTFVAGFISCVALIAFYAPLLLKSFAFHNDWIALLNSSVPKYHPEFSHLVSIGRPLGALLLNFSNHIFYSTSATFLHDIMFARFVSLFFLVVIQAYFVFRLCSVAHIAPWIVSFFSFFIFILPAYRLNCIWQSNFVPGILGCLGSVAAFECFYYGYNRTKRYAKILFFLFSVGFLNLTHLIYTPSASFFLFFILVVLLFSERHSNVFRFSRDSLLLYIFSSGLYFLFLKYVQVVYKKGALPGYTLSVSSSISTIFLSAISLLKHCASLWFATNPPFFGYLYFSIILIVCLVFRENLKRNYKTVLLALFIVILTMLPNILTQTKFNIHFRSTAALQSELAIIFMYFAFMILSKSKCCYKIVHAFAASLFIIFITVSFAGTDQAIRNQSEQYNYIKYTLISNSDDLNKNYCPIYFSYSHDFSQTIVDDFLLPLDFAYPTYFMETSLDCMVRSLIGEKVIPNFRMIVTCDNNMKPHLLDARRICANCNK